jgi:hypothetical protein
MSPGLPPDTEPSEPQAQRSEVGLATITLRQVRVSRADVQDMPTSADANPMNRLVPYLDLYGRLSDDELARLADVPASVVNNLRRQVIQVDRALARFTDLLPRLTDAELVRLTGATAKTIRFWRLCQPRFPVAGADAQGWSVAHAADALGRVQSSAELSRRAESTGTHHSVMSDEPPLDSGAPLEPRYPPHRMASVEREPGPTHRMPTAERESGPYRMANTERDSAAHRMANAERESATHRMATAERETGTYRMPIAERESGAYRMPIAEREAGRRFDPPPIPAVPRPPAMGSVESSRPRMGRGEEMPTVSMPPPTPVVAPERVQKQQAVAQQMAFSGAPFPGYDSSGEVVDRPGEDDGIFIGLELPDPRGLPQPGRRD